MLVSNCGSARHKAFQLFNSEGCDTLKLAKTSMVTAGDLTITSGALLSFATTNGFTQTESYTIATYTGNLSGVFNFGVADPWGNLTERTIGGGQYLINYGSGMNSFITLTAVPEPGTFALLGLALAGLALLRIRKRRREALAVTAVAGE